MGQLTFYEAPLLEKVLQKINQMSNVSISIFKEYPENWQRKFNWAACQVFFFSPISYVTSKNYEKFTERLFHFIETYNVKTLFSAISTWDQLAREESRS